ncbi:hypothetical protein [Hyphomicrobium sp. MC1]|uniref:hypothetical protein n=1 Tax=Hyphomicrobium sp. (strain MC1) TaxID=717785 RepID=UPI000213EB1A|nr:hypothetical protein [Hyphomicrobium sp. MC1]CCB65381.1 protein of unknown function [Hyphomicrobium sp. MC1]
MSLVASGYNLEDPAEFKAWCVHYPKAAKLLASIIRSWQRSKAKLRDDPHTWAAYPLRTWCKWTGLKLRTLERYLAFLEVHGLIRRERGPFAGNTLHVFIRPTRRALAHHQLNKASKPNASITSPKPHDVSNVVDYVAIWQNAMIKNGHLKYCVLTKTERHLLKEAVASMPPEHITGIIETGLQHWTWFVKYIETHTEEFNLASTPSTKSFAKHVNHFTSCYLAELEVVQKPKLKPRPTVLKQAPKPEYTDEYLDALEDG